MIEGEDRYARLSARLLRSEGEQQAEISSTPADTQRDAVVAAMALAIAAKARRRRIVTASAVVLAAAASVLVVLKLAGQPGLTGAKPAGALALVVEYANGRGNQLVRAASTQPLPDLGVLAVGDSVRSSEDGSAMLGFSNGTRITLSSAAQLRVDDLGATRRFSLLSGHFQAHVAKLGQGERFVVSTPDSEVEVRGTVFTVAVEGPSSTCRDQASSSTVSVSEGAVWVRSGGKQIVIRPGESWSTPCQGSQRAALPTTAGAEPIPSAAPNPIAIPVRAGPRKPAAPKIASVTGQVFERKDLSPAPAIAPSLAPPTPVSRLAEQNDLFSAAMAAERAGQHDLALRKLDELTARYPSGPFGESARAERQRILSAKP